MPLCRACASATYCEYARVPEEVFRCYARALDAKMPSSFQCCLRSNQIKSIIVDNHLPPAVSQSSQGSHLFCFSRGIRANAEGDARPGHASSRRGHTPRRRASHTSHVKGVCGVSVGRWWELHCW